MESRDLSHFSLSALATKHIDLKQLELDTAVAKVDELSKQLESLFTDNSGQVVERYSLGSSRSQELLSKMSPVSTSPSHQYSWKSASSPSGLSHAGGYSPSSGQLLTVKSPLGRPVSPRPSFFLQGEIERPQSPRPKVLPVSYDPVPSPLGHVPSPRSLRPSGPSERQYEYLPYSGQAGRTGSPRLAAEGAVSQMFFPDRGPPPRPPLPPPYENHSMYPSASKSFLTDDLVIRRRSQKNWNESDLDVAYEKKPSHSASYERGDVHLGLRQSASGLPLAPWRESSLDGTVGKGKDHYGMHSSTLPRNYKVSLLASERRQDSTFRRSMTAPQTGTLPRNWQYAQQPISRIPMPPSSPQGRRPKRHKPLPLSMIFKLQNAFWEYGAASGTKAPPLGPLGSPLFLRASQKQPPVPLRMAPAGSDGNGRSSVPEVPAEPVRLAPATPLMTEVEPELETLLPGSEPAEVEEVARPLSPTRLQPVLPPEAQKVPEFEEVARVLAEMPRPLKRRGSMEQNPGPVLPPTHKKQYQQIISRLFHHHHPRKEEAVVVGEAVTQTDLPPITETLEAKVASPVGAVQPAPQSPPALGPAPHVAVPESPLALIPAPGPEKRSVLRKMSSPRKRLRQRVRLNPLVLLLDAALTGELEVVQQAVKELNDPSQPNDEGITALHNAICGANYNIVDFLINIGANVNSPDSHGWTPLHCAASCNDTTICMALIKHGAAIFATTFTDGSMAIEKCDPYREGYSECFNYLAGGERRCVHWDYIARQSDELSFREGEPVTVLRRDSQEEMDWWWASLYGQEGYVPKNYFGLFPRVRPQWKKL
uniref:Protein phosphatase 1 regulatory subunit 13 like n=1 Tax=Sphenodon punctatus TaxID=8508 RepID=A0A8D0L7C7_SPHPU